MNSFVVAIMATRHRPREIERLLTALAAQTTPLGAVIIVDNGAQAEIAALARASTVPVEYLAPARNLGCGAALRFGEEHALRKFPHATHIWIMDDDVVPPPNALTDLLAALATEKADAAAPLIVDEHGQLGWEAGLSDPETFRIRLESKTPAEFIERVGAKPLPFDWTQGICLLITRRVLTELGPHANDYWIRGEDFEFSLRISDRWPAILVPIVVVQHLMPSRVVTPESQELEYRKQCAMVQNVAYLGLHVPHGRRLLTKIPGRFYWHFRNWGFSFRTLRDAAQLFWEGAIRRHPAGHPSCPWPSSPRV